jgi:hypothetical protein
LTIIYGNRGEIHLEVISYLKSETTFLNLYICGNSRTLLGVCTMPCQYLLLSVSSNCRLL